MTDFEVFERPIAKKGRPRKNPPQPKKATATAADPAEQDLLEALTGKARSGIMTERDRHAPLWQTGQRIYHLRRGYGTIVDPRPIATAALCRVCFEQPQETTYIKVVRLGTTEERHASQHEIYCFDASLKKEEDATNTNAN